MGRSLKVALFCALIGICEPSGAEIQPSFHLHYSAWKSTDVVMIDAEGRVLETFKGDLEVGTILPIADWKLMSASKVFYNPDLPAGAARIDSVSGNRRIVFLIRNHDHPADRSAGWRAATMDSDFNTAAVWLEQERAFAIRDLERAPPLPLCPLCPGKDLKAAVVKSIRTQQELRSASAQPDPGRRAELVVPFVMEENYLARYEALDVLCECGDAAWPVVKPLILDAKRLPEHSLLIHVLEKVAPQKAVPLIESIIGEEVSYWDALDKVQQRSYYNSPMSYHYSKICACLFVLKRIGYRDHRGIVAALQAKWDADPILSHLGSDSNRSPVLQYADEILEAR